MLEEKLVQETFKRMFHNSGEWWFSGDDTDWIPTYDEFKETYIEIFLERNPSVDRTNLFL